MAENVNFYAAWEPVRINAGNGSTNSDYGIETGFFINSTGLQWTSSVGSAGSEGDAFGGWLGKSNPHLLRIGGHRKTERC